MATRDQVANEVERVLRGTVSSLVGPPGQNDDGGFGREPGMASEPWSTSEMLILAERVRHMVDGVVTLDQITAMREFVLRSQRSDGGWGSDTPISDVVGTTLALMALQPCRDQEPVRKAAERGLQWLATAQNSDGGWNVVTASPRGRAFSTTYPTLHGYEAIGVWSLDNTGPISLGQQALNDARVWLNQVRSGHGLGETPGQAPTVRHTAYAVLVDRSELFTGTTYEYPLNLPRDEIVRWLEAEQHTDGMWSRTGATGGSGDLESTAAAVRALLLLGCSPDSRVQAAVEALLDQKVERKVGDHRYHGWPSAPGGGPTSWLTYYVAMALLDYLRAARTRPPEEVRVRFPRWRRTASLVLLVATATAATVAVLLTGTAKWALTVLTVVAAIANIVVAFPLVGTWLRRRPTA